MAKRTARSAKHDVTRLVALLSSADTAVAGDAANQLTQMGPKAERAIPDLVRYLARSAFSDRVFFVGSELPRIGRAVFEPLLREFETRDTRALDHTFGCVAPNHPDLAIPLLKHDRPHIRLATCYALYKQKSAVEPLIESLADRSPRIREIAGCALKSIGSAAIRQLKAAMEQSADAEFRERCLNVLAQIRPSQYAKRTSRFQKEQQLLRKFTRHCGQSYYMVYRNGHGRSLDRVGGRPTHLPGQWPMCDECGEEMAFVGQLYADDDWFPLDGNMCLHLDACVKHPLEVKVVLVPFDAAEGNGRIGHSHPKQPKLSIEYEVADDPIDHRAYWDISKKPELLNFEPPLKGYEYLFSADKIGGVFPFNGDEIPEQSKDNQLMLQVSWKAFKAAVYVYKSKKKGWYAFAYS
jgi:hypothetical protein